MTYDIKMRRIPVTFSFFPLIFSTLMAVPNHQLPGQQEPQTDSREWTTPDQKIHLQSRHGEYVIARDNSRLKTWFCTELRTYFDLFPTEPVTVIEGMLNPDWTIGDKRLFEEMVSDSRLNGSMNAYRWRTNSESRRGLKTTVVLQRNLRERSEKCSKSTNGHLKSSVHSSTSRRFITGITTVSR